MKETTYTPSEIQKILRTAYRLSLEDFIDFSTSMGNPTIEYMQKKWEIFSKSPADYIFSLDNQRMVQFCKWLHNRNLQNV